MNNLSVCKRGYRFKFVTIVVLVCVSLLFCPLSTAESDQYSKQFRVDQSSNTLRQSLQIASGSVKESESQRSRQLQNRETGVQDPTSDPEARDFAQTAMGRTLTLHLQSLADGGPNAERKYQASLRRLRADSAEAARTLWDAYQRLTEVRYFRRWTLVETLKELQSGATLAALERIALAPIPAERSRDKGEFSSVEEELIIRMTAIEGLSGLGRAGSNQAEMVLRRLLDNPHLSIRRGAIRGYLNAGRDFEARARFLRSRLRSEDHRLITLAVTDLDSLPFEEVNPKPKVRRDKRPDPPPRIANDTDNERPLRFLAASLTSGRPSLTLCVYQANVIGNAASGDNFYSANGCSQSNIDECWEALDFDQGDWDDGLGYEAPCNVNRPLSRTLNALFLLRSQMPVAKMFWFYPYAAGNIDELDAVCQLQFTLPNFPVTSGTFARTFTGLQDNRTELYWPFFYGLGVVERAGTIVHEARHGGGKEHNGGIFCPRKGSCDSKWSYEGANTWQVRFLWRFFLNGIDTTSGIKNRARQRGQAILDIGFVIDPGYVI